jgi:hypothetical protein
MFGSFPPSPLVGLRFQSLLGPGSRHCYGIITLIARKRAESLAAGQDRGSAPCIERSKGAFSDNLSMVFASEAPGSGFQLNFEAGRMGALAASLRAML